MTVTFAFTTHIFSNMIPSIHGGQNDNQRPLSPSQDHSSKLVAFLEQNVEQSKVFQGPRTDSKYGEIGEYPRGSAFP